MPICIVLLDVVTMFWNDTEGRY